MKVSELTTDTVAKYMRADLNDETTELINMALIAAKSFCTSYTGKTIEELDLYDDVPLAVLALCSEFYDLRQFTVSEVANANPTTIQILNSYSVNLI